MDEKDNKLSNLDKPLTTWELMRATQSDDEKKELDEVELRNIKSRKYSFDKKLGKYKNENGSTANNFLEAQRQNQAIRKEASAIIKDKNKLNLFMRAPDYEHYKSGPMETALNNVIAGENLEVKPTVTPVVEPLDRPINSTPIKNNETNNRNNYERPLPDFLKPQRDPDLDSGIAQLLGKIK